MANSLPDATGYSGEGKRGLFIPFDLEPSIAVRQCMEMAEMFHQGSYDAFLGELREFVSHCERAAVRLRPWTGYRYRCCE